LEIVIDILDLLVRGGPQKATWVIQRCNITHRIFENLVFSLMASGLAEKVEVEGGVFYRITERGKVRHRIWVEMMRELFLA